MPQRRVLKTHDLKAKYLEESNKVKIITSVRDPVDSISSSIQRYSQVPTDDVVVDHIKRFERYGIWQVLEVKDYSNVTILRYEDFAFDWAYLFESLETSLGCNINQDTRRICFSKYSLERVAQKAAALGDFGNIDSKDQIHGKHISNFRGRVGYGRDYLSLEQIDLINKSLRPYSEAFGYLDL
ncbi:MAG: sulfotransferase domain-containing protein [Verrucomicrobiota bacterium]|nr:sulfotransferase domain-containing protein [Verrucomicrobiota bacterium]